MFWHKKGKMSDPTWKPPTSPERVSFGAWRQWTREADANKIGPEDVHYYLSTGACCPGVVRQCASPTYPSRTCSWFPFGNLSMFVVLFLQARSSLHGLRLFFLECCVRAMVFGFLRGLSDCQDSAGDGRVCGGRSADVQHQDGELLHPGCGSLAADGCVAAGSLWPLLVFVYVRTCSMWLSKCDELDYGDVVPVSSFYLIMAHLFYLCLRLPGYKVAETLFFRSQELTVCLPAKDCQPRGCQPRDTCLSPEKSTLRPKPTHCTMGAELSSLFFRCASS